MNLLLLVGILLVARRQLGVATIFTVVVSGYVTQFWLFVIRWVFPEITFEMRIVFLIVGVSVTCIGSALYYTADLGVSVYDACARSASERGLPFRVCRIATDVLCTALGFLLGAAVGVGTIITALCMGPLIELCNRSIATPLLRRMGVT